MNAWCFSTVRKAVEGGGEGREERRGISKFNNRNNRSAAQPLSRCERAEANILSSIAALAAVLNSLVSMMLAGDAEA